MSSEALTPYDLMLGTPPGSDLPDWLVDQLHEIEREFRGFDSDDVVTFGGEPPVVRWRITIRATGADQRDAIAMELERLAGLLRKAGE